MVISACHPPYLAVQIGHTNINDPLMMFLIAQDRSIKKVVELSCR